MLAQRRRMRARKAVRAALMVAGLMSCDPGKRSPPPASDTAPIDFPVYSPPSSALPDSSGKRKADTSEMVGVDSFLIDRYEAHLVELVDGKEMLHPYNYPVCANIEGADAGGFVYGYFEKADKDPRCKAKIDRMVAKTAKGVRPQGYISQPQAAAACRNAKKRLCTLKEWVKACKGRLNLKFSYGNEADPTICNLGAPHHLGEFFDRDPNDWSFEDFNHPRLNERPGFLSETGNHPKCRADHTPKNCIENPGLMECASDFGVYDMLGNLQEWVGDSHTFVGGFYSNPAKLQAERASGLGCDYKITAHGKNYHDYSQGFRCCLDIKKKEGD